MKDKTLEMYEEFQKTKINDKLKVCIIINIIEIILTILTLITLIGNNSNYKKLRQFILSQKIISLVNVPNIVDTYNLFWCNIGFIEKAILVPFLIYMIIISLFLVFLFFSTFEKNKNRN